MTKQKLAIIDGHSYLFRAYYGIPQSAKTKNGIMVNAVYGFFAFLRRIVAKIEPEYILIVFDSETGIHEKQEVMKEYKANRFLSDTRIFEQIPIICKILERMDIKYIENSYREGDDIIGSVANTYAGRGLRIYVSSSDYDFCQIVNDTVLLVREERGKSVLYTREEIKRKFGIFPEQFVDFRVLTGDRSDNIRGIKGIGAKRAATLLNRFQTLDNIFMRVDELADARIKGELRKERERCRTIKKLLTIRTDSEKIEKIAPNNLRYNKEEVERKISEHIKEVL